MSNLITQCEKQLRASQGALATINQCPHPKHKEATITLAIRKSAAGMAEVRRLMREYPNSPEMPQMRNVFGKLCSLDVRIMEHALSCDDPVW